MRAVILAGGRGTRLHPLTTDTPKPLVPMFDKPVLEHAIGLLARHGIRDIIITVSYKASQIMEWLGHGARQGVNITYYVESQPKGTAGGLSDLAPLLNDTFVVLSGDAVTDFDLTSAIRFHQCTRARATLLVYEVDDPSQFGLVQMDADGRVDRFVEKPAPDQVFGNTVNTGIYILEPDIVSHIPRTGVFDFSRDLFPILLKRPGSLMGCRMDGYWCDVGNLAQYRDAHFDAMTGRVRLDIPGRSVLPGVWVGQDCSIHPTARICGPVYLGHGVVVGANAFLGGYAAVGEGSIIGANARIAQSIIGQSAWVAPGSSVYGSVIGPGHELEESVRIDNRIVLTQGLEREIQPSIGVRLISDVTLDMHVLAERMSQITGPVSQANSSAA